MNRRGFLKMIGLAPVAVAAAPLLAKIAPAKPSEYHTYAMGKNVAFNCHVCGKPSGNDYLCDPCHYKKLHKERGPGGWVSYRFHMTTTLPPNANKRIRFIDAASAMS